MKTSYLILGGTGGIGYAVADNLLNKKIPITILARDRKKAQRLFGDNPLLEVIEGDVQDPTLLKRIAADKQFIFHGINYAYDKWFGNIDTATAKVIEAASINNATIIYPGSVYNFGLNTSIRENSKPSPNSRKGALRVILEEMMQIAASQGKIKVKIVRLPDFWGPNVVNHGVEPIFLGALKNQSLPYLANATVAHQFVYTKDAAEVIVRLMQLHTEEPFKVYNYGGQTFTSATEFLHQVATVAGSPKKVKVMRRWQVALLAIFIPVMKEVKEMIYLFEHPILLNDQYVKGLMPDFFPTPLFEAIGETLEWFKQHRLKTA